MFYLKVGLRREFGVQNGSKMLAFYLDMEFACYFSLFWNPFSRNFGYAFLGNYSDFSIEQLTGVVKIRFRRVFLGNNNDCTIEQLNWGLEKNNLRFVFSLELQ